MKFTYFFFFFQKNNKDKLLVKSGGISWRHWKCDCRNLVLGGDKSLFEEWLVRQHGVLPFRLMQILTEDGCFWKYMIRREETPWCHHCVDRTYLATGLGLSHGTERECMGRLYLLLRSSIMLAKVEAELETQRQVFTSQVAAGVTLDVKKVYLTIWRVDPDQNITFLL